MYNDFTEILTGLYNGNRGAAEQTAEDTSPVNTDYLTEEYDRMRQYRINYGLAMRKQYNSYCNY